MPKHVDPPRFIRLPQVLETTGLSTSTIYRWMTDGTFPEQIQIGGKSAVWNERDVNYLLITSNSGHSVKVQIKG